MPLLNEAAAQSAGTTVPGPAETRVGTSNRTAPAKEKNGS